MHKPLYASLATPHTVWRTADGSPGYVAAGPLARAVQHLLGRLRRLRAHWRRQQARHGVRHLDL